MLLIDKSSIHHPIYVGKKIYMSLLPRIIRKYAPEQCVIITDDTVNRIHVKACIDDGCFEPYKPLVLSLPPGERSKTRSMKVILEDNLTAAGCLRNTLIIAMGGGVVTDMAGFVAATYMRGIPYISIPTSLLAMVDAAIGGKTGVNTNMGKNLIGAFHQPGAVVIDISTLQSLPMLEQVQGLAEMIKHAMIADADIFQQMCSMSWSSLTETEQLNLIYRNCQIKMELVTIDQLESGLRAALNFGHTIAHALERASEFQIPHGIAVLFGLLVETACATECGRLPKEILVWLHTIIEQFELPWQSLLAEVDVTQIMQGLKYDKKNISVEPRFIRLQALGRVSAATLYQTFELGLVQEKVIGVKNQLLARVN